MFFGIPLDLRFSEVFNDICSGERTPTGAVRRGLRPDPHRRRGAAESEQDSVHGHLRPGPRFAFGWSGEDGESAPGRGTAQAGSRSGVRSDRVVVRPQGRTAKTETCWVVRETGRVGEADRTGSRPSGRVRETGQWCGAEGPGATPTGLREDGSDWHQLRGLGQPGQRETVTIRCGSGQPGTYPKSDIARRYTFRGEETGDVIGRNEG